MTTKKLFNFIMFSFLLLILVGCKLTFGGQDNYTKIFNHLSIVYQEGNNDSFVTKNITLPTEVTLDIEFESVSWTSSHPEIIQTNGIVNRPTEDMNVILTLIVTIDGVSKNKTYNISVIGTNNDMKEMYTIFFDSRGGTDVLTRTVIEGEKIIEPVPPTRTDHTFLGWFTEQGLINEWDFANDIVTSNLILYAKWEEKVIIVPEPGTLTFYDEFEGDTLDSMKWSFQTGAGAEYGIPFWGNGEKQYYKSQNAEVSDGTLKFHAKMEQTWDNGTKSTLNYSSSKIVTQNKFAQTFGRFEARIKAPLGDGFWPAFWLMPANNNKYGNGWPYNGEIDIMEIRGRIDNMVSSAIHFHNGGGHQWQSEETVIPNGGKINEFHVYAVDWVNNKLEFSVDGYVYHTRQGSWTNAPQPFDQDFYIILNLAIGGQFDGHRLPDPEDFPAALEIDYVRVYAK